MGGGLPANCRRKSTGFLTPFGAVLRSEQHPIDAIEISDRTKNLINIIITTRENGWFVPSLQGSITLPASQGAGFLFTFKPLLQLASFATPKGVPVLLALTLERVFVLSYTYFIFCYIFLFLFPYILCYCGFI